jgi:putative redox protein
MASLSVEWNGGLSFTSAGDGPELAMASRDPAKLSPMQVLAYAVMGCMGMDVAHVLEKGRHQLAGMTVRFDGERDRTHPRRYTAIALHFDVTTTAAAPVVERAIDLSRTKYCPVWNSLRGDIALTTSYTIYPVDTADSPDPS